MPVFAAVVHTHRQIHMHTDTHILAHMQAASLWLKTSNANNIFGAA